MRAVQHRQCRSKKEATRYYFRAGALLFLVHWLRGVDFHAGNIIAHGTQPIFVDCETLFHPEVPVPRGAKREAESILRTGMLPIWKSNPNVADSVSALGRKTFGPHTVRVKGQIVSAAEFIDSITQGFQAMSRFLLNSRGAAKILKRLRRVRYRRIYEPTASYYHRLEHSLMPSVLICGRARHRAISRLCQTKRCAFDGRVRREIQNLEDADIPIFHGKALRPRSNSMGETNRNLEIIRSALTANHSVLCGTVRRAGSPFRNWNR
jgi:lantibiotic modifying enzyme